MNPPGQNWFFTFLLFIGAGSLILFGGLFFAKRLEVHDRKKIDANGKITTAAVYKKTSNSKGASVFYRFHHGGKTYTGSEAGRDLYEQLNKGDSITIKYQLTDPSNSYVFSVSLVD